MKLKLIVLRRYRCLLRTLRADDSMLKVWITTWTRRQSDDEADVTGSMLNDAAHTIGFRGGKAERAKNSRRAGKSAQQS